METKDAIYQLVSWQRLEIANSIGEDLRQTFLHISGNVNWMIWWLRSRVLKRFKSFQRVITRLVTFPNLEINSGISV